MIIMVLENKALKKKRQHIKVSMVWSNPSWHLFYFWNGNGADLWGTVWDLVNFTQLGAKWLYSEWRIYGSLPQEWDTMMQKTHLMPFKWIKFFFSRFVLSFFYYFCQTTKYNSLEILHLPTVALLLKQAVSEISLVHNVQYRICPLCSYVVGSNKVELRVH